MPCLGPDEADYSAELRGELNQATNAACSALKLLEKDGRLSKLDKDVQEWWKLHKKRDAERQREEAQDRKEKEARKKALSKLSRKEREALGVSE